MDINFSLDANTAMAILDAVEIALETLKHEGEEETFLYGMICGSYKEFYKQIHGVFPIETP